MCLSLDRLVGSPRFELLTGLVILVDGMVIGMQLTGSIAKAVEYSCVGFFPTRHRPTLCLRCPAPPGMVECRRSVRGLRISLACTYVGVSAAGKRMTRLDADS